jgi:hypothetical protein
MQEVLNPPRRRSRWLLFVMPGVLLLLAIGWTGFWFYASSQVGAQFERWRTREAQSGRVYDCGKLAVGGYPFRFEVRCKDASVDLISQTANRKFGKGQLSEILAVGHTGHAIRAARPDRRGFGGGQSGDRGRVAADAGKRRAAASSAG